MRVTVSACVVKSGKILLIKFKDKDGIHYNLPGGGVDECEPILTALKREAKEEAGVKVIPKKLLMCWEYTPSGRSPKFGKKHKMGMVFLCGLESNSKAKFPKKPDKNQIDVEWVPLQILGTKKCAPLYPQIEKTLISRIKNAKLNFKQILISNP